MVIAKTEIRCDICRKSAMHPLRTLVGVDTATCPFCRYDNDITHKRARIDAMAEKYREMEDFLDI